MGKRLETGVTRGRRITFTLAGRGMEAFEGETLAAALLAAGVKAFRRDRDGRWRGPWCGMGVCYDCLLKLEDRDGAHWVRACTTPVAEGMQVDFADEAKA